MYKYLLCWRYLRTRYIALASVISVMLGVATMIVVNAVMAGFSERMRDRLHGVLADISIESESFTGFGRPEEVMALARQAAGGDIEAMAAVVDTPAIMTINYMGQPITRPVQLMGIEPAERAKVGEFAKYLFDDSGEKALPPSFDVPAWMRAESPAGRLLEEADANDPFREVLKQHAGDQVPDHGAILGWALATVHHPQTGKDVFIAPRGAKVVLTFPSAGQRPEPARDAFTVVGFFKSGMSEYDSTHVYVPLDRLQHLRHMGDGEGHGAINQIQVKVRAGADLDALAARINHALFAKWPHAFRVQTWEQKQGPLLAAVAIEKSILNILLFFIIAVAGFGILAIFSMIVVEKTRDIGILKALGASTAGVRGIFLGYGLSLGLVGSGVGMLGGLLFVWNINPIEKWLSRVLGHKVFDDTIYYFNEIPTRVDAATVAAIVLGALLIAVAASVWPAQRAAKLHPVRALRYE